ncbi:MAG: TonB-dependent receptor [Pseudomonadota bacterium]
MKTIKGKPHVSNRLGVRRLIVSTLAAAVSAAITGAPSALAQEDPSLEEITVTGSRIRQQSGFETPIPVTTMTTEELFDFEPGNTVSEQLDALPQFFNNTGLQQVSTAQVATSGSTSLNIRNLGGNRTLVLFDGIRVVPAAKEGAVNVDGFPTALLRSVDVVTGGASAAYGADAVGGVVNFVLDRQFKGFVFDTSTGMNEEGDGELWNISMAGGKAFMDDRLNIIGSVETRKIEGFARRANEVEEMQRWGHVTNPNYDPKRAGALDNPLRLTRRDVTSLVSSPTGMILGSGTSLDRMQFSMDGKSIQPFVLGDVSALGGTQTTSGGPEAALSNDAFGGGIGGTEAENTSAFLAAQYELSDTFSVFAQGMYGKTIATSVNDRGSFLFSGQWAPLIAVDNAYLPESVRQVMIANNKKEIAIHKNGSFVDRPEVGQGGEGIKTISTSSYSAGFEWDLPVSDWHLRGVYQDGQSDRTATFGNLFRVDRAFLAMDAVRDPANGAIVCRVQLVNPTPQQLAAAPIVQGKINEYGEPLKSPIGLDNTVKDCTPYNYMGSGNLSKEALEYIEGDAKTAVGFVDQQFAEILLTGELYEGWGPGAVSFASGLTWREQSFKDRTYPREIDELGPVLNAPELGIRGIPIGYAAPNTNGSLHYISSLPNVSGDNGVWEYFGELNVPLWEGNLIGQNQQLETNLAFRRSDYDRSGQVDSWKIGFNLQLMEDVRLRYTTSRDVREPSFAELFDSQGTNGVFRDARIAGNPERQISKTSGGNANLKPEEADTVTAGVVFTPSFVEGLQVSLDWYDVSIDGAVGTLGEQRITDECFLNNVQSLCAQIEMDAAGTVTRVFDTFLNVAQATVEGYDLEFVYRIEPDLFADQSENFSIRALAGYVEERTDTPLGGRALDRSGTRNSPDLTSVLTTNYGIGPYSVQLQARYIDSTALDGTWIEGRDVDDNTLPSMTWWNLGLGYNGETSNGASWRVGFNVQNLFDRSPIIVPTTSTRFAIQGFSGDTYGRRYNVSLNYNF